MPRAIWKGAIAFGLVHVPVALYPASDEVGIDFDWLDKRSMDPVGYQRINKRTGKQIASDQVVKGIKQEDGDYVILSEDQIKAAYPKATQSIEIETFVKADEIPFLLFEKPYFLEPIGKSAKVYALLRESMRDAEVIGIARIVIHVKEHLAALVPLGSALVLNTLRWASELRPVDDLNLPAEGKSSASLKPGELKMASQLIRDMTGSWDSSAYQEQFGAAVQALVTQKLKAGDTRSVAPVDEEWTDATRSNVVDLSELLARSLAKRKPAAARNAKTERESGARSTARSPRKRA
jgi:DNA end-binding protein Ku